MARATRVNRRMVGVALAAAAIPVAACLVAPTSAGAAALPSNCPKNYYSGGAYLRLCLYYDGNGTGAYYRDYQEQTSDFAGIRFGSSGDGAGQYVKNNAASAADAAASQAYLFYNEHCSGPYDAISGYSLRNLVNTWNDEASYENPYLGDGTVGGC